MTAIFIPLSAIIWKGSAFAVALERIVGPNTIARLSYVILLAASCSCTRSRN